jgi:hypothetical protein
LGKFPFPGELKGLDFWQLTSMCEKDIHVNLDKQYSSGIRSFISACLKASEDLRVGIENLVSHEWVRQFSDKSTHEPFKNWISQNAKTREANQASLKTVSLGQIGVGRKR